MKDKALYFIIGLLVGAILTTGVFMLINKNNGGTNNNGRNFDNRGPMMRDGGPPSQEELDMMEKTIMEDGSVQYRSPNGGMVIQHKEINGGPGGGPKGQ